MREKDLISTLGNELSTSLLQVCDGGVDRDRGDEVEQRDLGWPHPIV